jgi:hypothetical protein
VTWIAITTSVGLRAKLLTAPGATFSYWRRGKGCAAAQTIRVTGDVLEDLMTLVSELVLTRNQLLQLARSQKENTDFTVPSKRLSHITSDLQEGVVKTACPRPPSWALALRPSARRIKRTGVSWQAAHQAT